MGNASVAEPDGTLVLVCRGLGRGGQGLDLDRLGEMVAAAVPTATIGQAEDLCERPEQLQVQASQRVSRLVLGLCSAAQAMARIQREARKLGIDQFGVEVVEFGAQPLTGEAATRVAALMLAAACARAEAFEGSQPENAKVVLAERNERLTRRRLFGLGLVGYRPVPSIGRERCVAESGCDICVRACPPGALVGRDGAIEVVGARCQSCGICATACPRSAVALPGHANGQMAAQLRTLLASLRAEVPGQRSLLFSCRSPVVPPWPLGTSVETWLPVPVPCVGLIPAGWVLGALALGAARVAVAACADSCRLNQKAKVEGLISYCRAVLVGLGIAPETVTVLHAAEAPEPSAVTAMAWTAGTSFDFDGDRAGIGSADAILALADRAPAPTGVDGLVIRHEHSPLGVVEIDPAACTACGACAEACPSSALSVDIEGSELSVSFDASLCVACDLCEGACPERAASAIRVRRETDFGALRRGRWKLRQARAVLCQRCGAPVASGAMLRRLAEALGGPDDAPVLAVIGRTCVACRSALLLAPATSVRLT